MGSSRPAPLNDIRIEMDKAVARGKGSCDVTAFALRRAFCRVIQTKAPVRKPGPVFK